MWDDRLAIAPTSSKYKQKMKMKENNGKTAIRC